MSSSEEHQLKTRPEVHEETTPQVTREVDIDAPVEQVWEALATDVGRERWLEDDPDRVLIVEHSDPPRRVAWWWWSDGEPARHVDIRIRTVSGGSRVTVTETAPAAFPLATMAACLSRVSVVA